MSRTLLIAGLVAAALLGAAVYWMESPSPTPTSAAATTENPDIVSRNGIHWHSHLQIYVNGVRQAIPADIGIGPKYAGKPTYDQRDGMTSMHTHEADGTIHMEFTGVVTREQTKLGTFFAIWGKTFKDFGSKLIMKVNGVKNTEGKNYEMRDGDKIILSFFP